MVVVAGAASPTGASVVVVVDVLVVDVLAVDVVVPGGAVVEVVDGAGFVVDVVVAAFFGPGYTLKGVDEPGLGFHPAGGFVWDGTGPALATTTAVAGSPMVGTWWEGTGTPAACTRPKPARSDHHMELTRTTSPVWGALIMRPSPM